MEHINLVRAYELVKNEQDFKLWRNGDFYCCICRNGVLGNLCGYVGITDDHPFFGKDYDYVPAEVHGGLTYAESHCPWVNPEVFDKKIWWLGFDTAHSGDLSPLYGNSDYETYRNYAFVEKEIASLVEQLKSYKKLDLSHAIAEAKILGEWQRDKAAKEREEERKQIEQEEFTKKLLANSKDMPPHFVHLVSDNFWELLDYAEVKA